MGHSHRQDVEIQCENCIARFTAPVWLIVNPRENQRLAQSIARGTLNTLACPNCRRTTTARTPILLYQPDEPPAIVIAIDPGESQGEGQNQAHSLLAYLYSNLSPDEKKKLISDPEVTGYDNNGNKAFSEEQCPEFPSRLHLKIAPLLSRTAPSLKVSLRTGQRPSSSRRRKVCGPPNSHPKSTPARTSSAFC